MNNSDDKKKRKLASMIDMWSKKYMLYKHKYIYIMYIFKQWNIDKLTEMT